MKYLFETENTLLQIDRIEFTQCPEPSLNGEYLFAKIISKTENCDLMIDIGASNSLYPKIFNDLQCILVDTVNLPNYENSYAIKNTVGQNDDQVKLDDLIRDCSNVFMKIDTNGFEQDILSTLKKENFNKIRCLQFEYDCMWPGGAAQLNDVLNAIPFNDFFVIEFDGLKKLELPVKDNLYRNIVCGNIDFQAVSHSMNSQSIYGNLSDTHWVHPDSETQDKLNLLLIVMKNELHKYTQKRRLGLHNTPLFGASLLQKRKRYSPIRILESRLRILEFKRLRKKINKDCIR